jgi:hypothetical protein
MSARAREREEKYSNLARVGARRSVPSAGDYRDLQERAAAGERFSLFDVAAGEFVGEGLRAVSGQRTRVFSCGRR